LTISIIVDLNLAIEWPEFFRENGWNADHWSAIGDLRASDAEILAWAKDNSRIVVTSDLDFGALLAMSGATGPSVILIRSRDHQPSVIGSVLVDVMKRHNLALECGALMVVDMERFRLKILPILRNK
jgi:predicted nuclease of predicted toxin-antitoxin system